MEVLSNIYKIIESDPSLRLLSDWQIRCLIPVVMGRSLAAIALEVGKPVEVVRESVCSPLFREALSIATQELYEASGRLGAASTVEAVLVLKDIMGDATLKPSDRIKAATVILARGDMSDRETLLKRLIAVEEQLNDTDRNIEL